MDDIFAAIADLAQRGQGRALCTIIRTSGSTPRNTGSKMLVSSDGSIIGSVGGGEVEARVIEEAKKAILSGETAILNYDLIDPHKGDPGICGGTLEVFIDPLPVPNELIVVGAGHVGRAVVFLAKWLGYKVILSDDRPEFCSAENIPGADEYLVCKLEDLPKIYPVSTRAAVVLATRSQEVDLNGLPALLTTPVSYLGVISSRRRWKLTEEKLLSAGVNPEALNKIHAPIGIRIGAETPEEIALSILAEIIFLRNGGIDRSVW